MLPKSIKTNVFLIIEKNTKTYRYENIYKMAAKINILKSASKHLSSIKEALGDQMLPDCTKTTVFLII